MNRLIAFLITIVFFAACTSRADNTTAQEIYNIPPPPAASEAEGYDAEKGEGRFLNVAVSKNPDAAKAMAGENVYTAKCMSCHKLSEEKLVGPGLKGVTLKRHPAWVLNFITNTDAMLSKDPEARKQLEICIVRMPNLNLSDEEATNVYEFMRRNDGTE